MLDALKFGLSQCCCQLIAVSHSNCDVHGFWYFRWFSIIFCTFDPFLKRLWVLWKSYFSNPSPYWGLAYGSWLYSCGLWFQWQFNFQRFCNVISVCSVYLVPLVVSVRQKRFPQAKPPAVSWWGRNVVGSPYCCLVVFG